MISFSKKTESLFFKICFFLYVIMTVVQFPFLFSAYSLSSCSSKKTYG